MGGGHLTLSTFSSGVSGPPQTCAWATWSRALNSGMARSEPTKPERDSWPLTSASVSSTVWGGGGGDHFTYKRHIGLHSDTAAASHLPAETTGWQPCRMPSSWIKQADFRCTVTFISMGGEARQGTGSPWERMRYLEGQIGLQALQC